MVDRVEERLGWLIADDNNGGHGALSWCFVVVQLLTRGHGVNRHGLFQCVGNRTSRSIHFLGRFALFRSRAKNDPQDRLTTI